MKIFRYNILPIGIWFGKNILKRRLKSHKEFSIKNEGWNFYILPLNPYLMVLRMLSHFCRRKITTLSQSTSPDSFQIYPHTALFAPILSRGLFPTIYFFNLLSQIKSLENILTLTGAQRPWSHPVLLAVLDLLIFHAISQFITHLPPNIKI